MRNYPKEYRLSGKRAVDDVFARGRGGAAFPLRWLAVVEPSDEPGLQTLVGVPKKLFKRAVKRNFLKRRMREAVRLWGGGLRAEAVSKGVLVRLALLYTAKEPMTFAILERAVCTVLSRIELGVRNDELRHYEPQSGETIQWRCHCEE